MPGILLQAMLALLFLMHPHNGEQLPDVCERPDSSKAACQIQYTVIARRQKHSSEAQLVWTPVPGM